MIARALSVAALALPLWLAGAAAFAQTAQPAAQTQQAPAPQAPAAQPAAPQQAPAQPAQGTAAPSSGVGLATRVETAYMLNPYLSRYPIEVATQGGKVTLRGQVENQAEKDLAESVAQALPAVEAVVNELEITGRPRMDEERGRVEQRIRDAMIEARVKMRLYWDRRTHNVEADVESEAGTVRLTGHVQSTAQSDLAGLIARRTQGVEGVRNHLLVMIPKGAADEEYELPSESPGPFPELNEHIDDEWITRVVNTGIGFIRGIDPADIEVTSENRVVTLSGTVQDPEDSVRAVDFARAVIGIEEVRNQIIVKMP